jgi:hypothetical protein
MGTSGLFLISTCFGLLIISAVIIATLLFQIKDLKSQVELLDRDFFTIKAQLARVETFTQESRPQQTKILSERQRTKSISLDDAEMKLVRQFIRVLPALPGGQQKLHLGDDVPNKASVPVPDSLVDQLPKLRGARFLVDQSGAIVLIAAGSNRADALITPR